MKDRKLKASLKNGCLINGENDRQQLMTKVVSMFGCGLQIRIREGNVPVSSLLLDPVFEIF